MGKGQINVDLIFGYLAFLIFVWYFTGYMQELFTPFTDYANLQLLSKKSMLNINDIASFVNLNNINDACNISIPGKYGDKVTYTISGFNIYDQDSDYALPSSTNGSVLFIRDYGSFKVLAGTNGPSFNASLYFTIPNTLVKVYGINNSALDSYNESYDSYGNILFSVNLFANSTHNLSGYNFETGINSNAFLIVESFNHDMALLRVGSYPASASCTSGNQTSTITNENFYKRLGYGNNDFYGLINVESWWVNNGQ